MDDADVQVPIWYGEFRNMNERWITFAVMSLGMVMGMLMVMMIAVLLFMAVVDQLHWNNRNLSFIKTKYYFDIYIF